MNKNFILFFKFLLIILALSSIIKGIMNSILIGHDFDYRGATLMWQGINHYQYMLKGNETMDIQNGYYGQAFFVLLYPFTLLPLDFSKAVWTLINVLLSFFLPIFLSKKLNLDRQKTFYLLVLFLASTPCRVVIGNGQFSLIVVFFLFLPFFYKKSFYIILSGIAFIKYNIGYLLLLYFLSNKQIKNVVFSLIVFILSWFFYSFITNSNLFNNLLEPLKLALYIQATDGLVYGFSFLKFIFKQYDYLNYLIISLSIIFSFLLLNKIKKINNESIKLSLFCLIILIFSPLRNYDHILLLPLLLHSLKYYEKYFISKINIFFILYIFFGLRIIKELNIDIDANIVVLLGNFFIFIFLFISNYLLFSRNT
tara:strand:+ start:400 stop:1500 length:1101 start_codon:yes stop_codon:yes gene_type:complete